MQKARVVPKPDFAGRYPQAMPTHVAVWTKAGKEYVKQVDYPLGHPKNRMSDHEVEDKFRMLAAGQLRQACVQKVLDFVWKLDQAKDISVLMPFLNRTRRV
jgi:2-methylcitrate dehydratase PrpD